MRAWLHARERPVKRPRSRARPIRSAARLFLACGRGHVAVCEWLWAHGAAETRAPNALGFTPMAVGVASGELGVCAWLCGGARSTSRRPRRTARPWRSPVT